MEIASITVNRYITINRLDQLGSHEKIRRKTKHKKGEQLKLIELSAYGIACQHTHTRTYICMCIELCTLKPSYDGSNPVFYGLNICHA